ncbi:SHOCT domain-containing protein, partial [Candidatus Pelagibacter sp.]|nr:SHOCT domain-containing protein [Candidatus Pelagibacter sp.]
MEKIIFFAIALPILGFVFYLGGTAIMKGFKAKVDNRPDEMEENEAGDISPNNNQLSNEITKL